MSLDELSLSKFKVHKKGEWDAYVFDSCTSTFDIAREKIEEGAENGTLIIAGVQTGGKGRQNRKWFSPSGGIWMSIILKPHIELGKISSVTLLCAAAVCRTVEKLYPKLKPKIKWPNDVYINSKKACGILTETVVKGKTAEYVIVGIGINANNSTEHFEEELKQASVSFKDLGIYVERERMASFINDELQMLIKRFESLGDLSFILDYYTSRMEWIDEDVVMKNTITNEVSAKGILKGIDKEGRLLLKVEDKIIEVVSGELSLRRLS